VTNNKIVVKDFSYMGDKFTTLPTSVKKEILMEEINTSRYHLLGAVNQFDKFKLKCRYHNKRNKKGLWIR